MSGVRESEAVLDSSPQAYRRRRHYLTAALIGLIAGLVAVAFRYALYAAEYGRSWLLDLLHVRVPTFGWTVPPVLGLLAGLAVGWMMRRCPEAAGSGIPHLKGVLLGARRLNGRTLLPIKFVSGVIGIGAGLSLGREGPTVQMGAAVGQLVAHVTRTPHRAVPQLLTCGAGAGLAAAFNAPLAGFIFVIEELHRELSARTFVGAFVATIVATAVAESIGGQVPSFAIHVFERLPLWALPAAALLGVLGGLLGIAFNRALLAAGSAASRQSLLPRWTLPGLVGAVVGLVAWWMPSAVGGGHAPAEQLLAGHLRPVFAALVLWLAIKFATTVLSYGSGAAGGIFAPMLLLGAILGAAFGRVSSHAVPALLEYEQAFAVLGMAAVFVGSVRAPLTGVVLISEMTANYEQLFALSVTCLAAHLVGEAFREHPVYDALLEADLRRRPGGPRGPMDGAEVQTLYLGIQRGSVLNDVAIRDAHLPPGVVIVAIERSGREILPAGGTELRAGDHITVSVPEGATETALAVARMCLPTD
ncbi:MAG: H(+)/Cl(-) exchange transporter ClcA [Tepidisphaeraceae bacterium]